MQFAVDGHPDQFITYPMAGQQLVAGSQVTSLSDAHPTAIAAGSTINNTLAQGLELSTTLQGGLTVSYVKYHLLGDPPTNFSDIGAFAYLSKLTTLDGLGNISSGAQQFRLYGVIGTGSAATPHPKGDVVDALDDVGNYKEATEVDICLTDGGSRSGLIQIGNDSTDGQIAVTLDIRGTGNCT